MNDMKKYITETNDLVGDCLTEESEILKVNDYINLVLDRTTTDIRLKDLASDRVKKGGQLMKSIMRPILPKEVPEAKKGLAKIFKGLNFKNYDSLKKGGKKLSEYDDIKKLRKAIKQAEKFLYTLKFDGKDSMKF